MIVEIRGGKGGLKKYLQTGQKNGRDLHRNRLDQRIPLIGDLDVFELSTTIHEGEGVRYDHITLSFSENHVSDEMLRATAEEFREHALAAWPESERHRIAFYAEAHRPKILSYINSETGEEVERYTHVHVAIGRHDAATGKAVEVLGFLGPQFDNLKYIDAWQESFNARHGFASPKDNPKITSENAIDILARYSGEKPDAMGTFNEQKAFLELILHKELIARNITSWDGFGEILAEHGEVSKIREGQFNECYRIKPRGAGRAMRLKGVFFQRQFIERPTVEKISIIAEKARTAYLEQMQPRKELEYLAATLNEWRTIKARESRSLHTGSKFYKEVYKPADAPSRLKMLNDIERKNHGLGGPVANQIGKVAVGGGRMPGVPARNLDGIQKLSKMLLRHNAGMDVQAELIAGPDSLGLRQADRSGTAGNRNVNFVVEVSTDIEILGSADPGKFGSGRSERHAGQVGDPRKLHCVIQPSSVIARLGADLRERYEQAADKERYAEIRRNLDCTQLLNHLSHSHGLNLVLYHVTGAKDGTARIQCGSRALTPTDFLTREMGLPWKEAAPILSRVYEHQKNSEFTKPRGKSATAQLWKGFKTEQKFAQPVPSHYFTELEDGGMARRVALPARLKDDQTAAIANSFEDDLKDALPFEKRRTVTYKAERDASIESKHKSFRESIQPIEEQAWRLFLQAHAQTGNEDALAALRGLDATPRVAYLSAPSITGRIHLDHAYEIKRRLHTIESAAGNLHTFVRIVEINGDITYWQHGHAVLRDDGQRLAVLNVNSDEAIAAGLSLAGERFSTELTLTGSPTFKYRVVAVAVAQSINIMFIDTRLESMREQLIKDNRQVVRTRALQLTLEQTYERAKPTHTASMADADELAGDAGNGTDRRDEPPKWPH